MTIRERAISAKQKTKTITVPDLGGDVVIKEMTVTQRVAFANEWSKRPAVALVRVLIDGAFDPTTDKPVFERADQDTLTTSPGGFVQFITDSIFELSAMTDKSAAELEKNLQASAG